MAFQFGEIQVMNISNKLQHSKIAVKIITGAHWRDHVTSYNAQLGVLKLNEFYVSEVAKLMHKHTRKKLPINLSSLFSPLILSVNDKL